MYVPRLGAFATTPVAADAAVVMSAHVAPEMRRKGIGKQLVQSAAGLVARRDIRALEAVGTYHDGPSCTAADRMAGSRRLPGRTPPPQHSAPADGPAEHRTLDAWPGRRLEPPHGPRTSAAISRARYLHPTGS